MEEMYKPWKSILALVGAGLLTYAGLSAIAKHESYKYETRVTPTCINPGKDKGDPILKQLEDLSQHDLDSNLGE